MAVPQLCSHLLGCLVEVQPCCFTDGLCQRVSAAGMSAGFLLSYLLELLLYELILSCKMSGLDSLAFPGAGSSAAFSWSCPVKGLDLGIFSEIPHPASRSRCRICWPVQGGRGFAGSTSPCPTWTVIEVICVI